MQAHQALNSADREARQMLVNEAVTLMASPEKIRCLETEVRKLAFNNSAEVIAKIVIDEAEKNA